MPFKSKQPGSLVRPGMSKKQAIELFVDFSRITIKLATPECYPAQII